MKKFVKSTPPSSFPIGGMSTSFTSELTIAPKAAPMMTPIARSTALPLRANSRNSLSMARSPHLASAAERGLHLLERLEVLLQAVDVLLHLADRGRELRDGAERSAGLRRLLHGLPSQLTELGAGAPPTCRSAEEPRCEHRGQQHAPSPLIRHATPFPKSRSPVHSIGDAGRRGRGPACARDTGGYCGGGT